MSNFTESVLKRTRLLQAGEEKQRRPVVYWMSRDQRALDNYALLFAMQKAKSLHAPLAVLFCIVGEFLNATNIHFAFMLHGLKETAEYLAQIGIPLFVLIGNPEDEIPRALNAMNVSVLVTDFDPLKIKRQWKSAALKNLKCSTYEVDAHNVVPCFAASDKAEYSAFTFRKKVANRLSEFLVEFPPIEKKVEGLAEKPLGAVLIDDVLKKFEEPATNSTLLRFFRPGYKEGMRVLKNFIENKLDNYAKLKNDVLADAESALSPYIHFGQVSAQRIALEVKNSGRNPESVAAFLEQLIIRRELADNFCYYNPDYDSVKGFPLWARQTLLKHKNDRREFVYTLDEFENAKTHDEVWNAAQIELKIRGKIHNYLRMYWGKKILEWSCDAASALDIGNHLNNKYALDGRDPNGYVGVAWCIGGVHDRPFVERPVIGKIRPFGKGALERNFDVKKYVENVKKMAETFDF